MQLLFLIGLTFTPFLFLTGLIVHWFGANNYLFIFGMGFYLVLIKYALAYPLVTVENLGAGKALTQSWKMTKNHFWYVAGCYVILWAVQWAISWTIALPYGLSWEWLLVQSGLALVNSLWVILSWCMYLRIKKTEGGRSPETAALR